MSKSKGGSCTQDDVQSHLETSMSEEQKAMAVDYCLNHDSQFKADPLSTLKFHHDFVSANAHGSRSENFAWSTCVVFFATRREFRS